jgi:hypothetical protein
MLNLPATGVGQNSTSYFSLPLTSDPSYTGFVAAVTADNKGSYSIISVAVDANNPAPWTAGSLATAAAPYFVKILSGQEIGRIMKVTANTTSSLTLDVTDNSSQTVGLTTSGFSVTPGAVGVGDTFEIFSADTLGSVFGENTTQAATWTGTTMTVTLSAANPAIMVGATVTGTGIATGTTVTAISGTSLTLSAATTTSESGVTLTFSGLLLNGSSSLFTADTVSIYNPALFRWQTYFFNTASGVGYWELSGTTTNANNTILYPYGALTITRRPNEAATAIAVTGRVAEVPIITKTTGNNAIVYGSTDYPADLTLSQLQLGANWNKGSSVFTADTISIWDAALLRFDTYYQLSDSTWRKSGNSSTDQSSFVIPTGSAIGLLKRGTVSGAASFLPTVSTLPYSLN